MSLQIVISKVWRLHRSLVRLTTRALSCLKLSHLKHRSSKTVICSRCDSWESKFGCSLWSEAHSWLTILLLLVEDSVASDRDKVWFMAERCLENLLIIPQTLCGSHLATHFLGEKGVWSLFAGVVIENITFVLGLIGDYSGPMLSTSFATCSWSLLNLLFLNTPIFWCNLKILLALGCRVTPVLIRDRLCNTALVFTSFLVLGWRELLFHGIKVVCRFSKFGSVRNKWTLSVVNLWHFGHRLRHGLISCRIGRDPDDSRIDVSVDHSFSMKRIVLGNLRLLHRRSIKLHQVLSAQQIPSD